MRVRNANIIERTEEAKNTVEPVNEKHSLDMIKTISVSSTEHGVRDYGRSYLHRHTHAYLREVRKSKNGVSHEPFLIEKPSQIKPT